MSEGHRAAFLLAHLDSSRQGEALSLGDLEMILSRHLATAKAAWPNVDLEEEVYLQHLAEKICDRATEPFRKTLETIPAEDLYLAAACSHGLESAIESFRQTLMPRLRSSLRKIGLSPTAVEDTEQEVMATLFVTKSGSAHINTYCGRGRLVSWLRTIGTRTARRHTSLGKVQKEDEDIERIEGELNDPELTLLSKLYGRPALQSLAAALAALDTRQRILLKQYHVDGLTIDQLAAIYKVNRSTTARWVIAARTEVLDATRNHLRGELSLNSTEVDSLIRLVRSQFDISLREFA